MEYNFEPYGEETSNSRKDHPSSRFLNSHHHTLGDTHQGPHGPQLDMHKFDGTYLVGWVSQMEHPYCMHHINSNTDKYQVALLYLDVEC